MRMWKKICAVMTAGAICTMSLPWTVSAVVVGETGTYGDLTYTVLEDGTVEITDCDESATEVEIPAEIDGMAVTSIAGGITGGAFAYCDALTSITIPDGVTSIGFGAFAYCGSLPSITIPDGVTNLEDGAFKNCESLEIITIPESVESIGNTVFDGTPWLAAKQAENPLVIINHILIDGSTCTGDVEIPDGVTSILGGTFAECTSLTSIAIPDSVTSIASAAFSNCTSLLKISIGAGIQTLENIPYDSESLETIEVSPDNTAYASMDGILYSKDCTTLICCPKKKSGEALVPSGVTKIQNSAFDKCSSLTKITIPASATEIGETGYEQSPEAVFDRCSALNEIAVESGNPNYLSYDGILYDKNTSELLFCPEAKTAVDFLDGVTEIGYCAFEDCSLLKSIVIPNTVTALQEYAFRRCTALTKITIPSSVSDINWRGISECPRLTNIYYDGTEAQWDEYSIANEDSARFATIHFSDETVRLPEDFLEYSKNEDGTFTVYANNPCLIEADIPSEVDGVSVTGVDGFGSCYYLENITIPESVTNIGARTFSKCISLTSFIMPDSVTSIGEGAFTGCSNLKSIQLSDSLTELSGSNGFVDSGTNGIFADCTSLERIVIPDGVTSIGALTFYNCTSLSDITFPSHLDFVGFSAFEFTPWLENQRAVAGNMPVVLNGILIDGTHCKGDIVIPDGVMSIADSAFDDADGVTSVVMPDSITQVGDCAFLGCDALKRVELSAQMTEIPDYGGLYSGGFFAYSRGLKEVVIPKSITYIGGFSFLSTGLTDIYYTGTEEEWNAVEINESARLSEDVTIHYNYKGESSDIAPTTGDIDGDNTVDANDAYFCLLAYAKMSVGSDSGLTDAQIQAADVDGNGKVDANDAYYILLYYAKKSVGQDVSWDELLG